MRRKMERGITLIALIITIIILVILAAVAIKNVIDLDIVGLAANQAGKYQKEIQVEKDIMDETTNVIDEAIDGIKNGKEDKDEIPPEAFTISASDITETSFKVNGSTTDSGSGIDRYEIYINNSYYGTGQNVTGRTEGTTYSVFVRAYDKAGNYTDSNSINVTMLNMYYKSINATKYRGNIGKTYQIAITGTDTGTVWGTDVYTDDSNIAKAAVYEGLVSIGEKKIVTIEILSGESSYTGGTKNGITTNNYGTWTGSYRFVYANTNATAYRGNINKAYAVEVTGANTGTVWGTDIYTDDSNIAKAAVHAGLVKIGEKKVVHIQILAGQSSYTGSTRNGITTNNYGNWYGSYKFV